MKAYLRNGRALGLLVGVLAVFGCEAAPMPSEPALAPADSPAEAEQAPAPPPTATPPAPPASTARPPADAPTPPPITTILAGRPIQAVAFGETHVFTLETDTRTRLVATAKAPPHAVKVLVEEDVLDGVRFEGVGVARGRVFVADSYGAMKSAMPDGADVKQEYPFGNATRILSGTSQTLWLAELPQFLGDTFLFRWFGATTPANAQTTDLQMSPVGAVGDVAVDDEALVYATRGASTTLRQWAPFSASAARKGHKLLATLPEEARTVGVDAGNVYAHLVAAKEIRSIDRDTGTSTTLLSNTSFDTPPMLRSDGTHLYMLTETALRSCTIASCATTLTVLASGLEAARVLSLDATAAYVVSVPKGKPGTILRIAR